MESGLNARQLGRLFGVTSRDFICWTLVNRVDDKYKNRFEYLYDTVMMLGDNQLERLSALLDSSSGVSLLETLYPTSDEKIQVSEYRLGI